MKVLAIKCTNAGCNRHIPYLELQSHCRQNCKHRVVKCPTLGCTWSGKVTQLPSHVVDNMPSHKLIPLSLHKGTFPGENELICRLDLCLNLRGTRKRKLDLSSFLAYAPRVDVFYSIEANPVRNGNSIQLTLTPFATSDEHQGFDYTLRCTRVEKLYRQRYKVPTSNYIFQDTFQMQESIEWMIPVERFTVCFDEVENVSVMVLQLTIKRNNKVARTGVSIEII